MTGRLPLSSVHYASVSTLRSKYNWTNDEYRTKRALDLIPCSLCAFSSPIMMFPIWSITENIFPLTAKDPRVRISFRCATVLVTALVAYSVPDFGKFLSLVGSSICTLLGFILPCYFHLAVMKDELVPWQRYLDYFLMLGGAVFGIMGTYKSVSAMLVGDLQGGH
jgi:solute carrier family 36 (proton-coupled amino acid transporter)